MRLLVVDDDADVRDLLMRALTRDGHTVIGASSLKAAEGALDTEPFDVVVLDLGLPDGSGVDLCRALRRGRDDVPILVLTARSEIARRVEALDAGADDFLAKPFAIAELRARVRALGRRRRAGMAVPQVTVGACSLDLGARRATRDGVAVALTPREWAILEGLALREGRVVSRHELLDEVWGRASDAGAASLEVLVGRIRKKLGESIVRTVRGEGYALGGPA